MDKQEPIAHAIQEFLDNALPNDGGEHTLVLGEHHLKMDHINYFSNHLKTLQSEHNLGTVGLEQAPFMNVFLWAYQDGILAQALGSREAARDYLKQVISAATKKDQGEAQNQTLDQLIAAMDMGIRTAAYDSRHLLSSLRGYATDPADSEHDEELKAIVAGALPVPPRDTLANNTSHQQRIWEDRKYAAAWIVGEVEWVLKQKPEYQDRLEAIENLIQIGHAKIKEGKLSSDALSAVMFNALAVPGKNRLTAIGFAHMDGIGDNDNSPVRAVHGTFPNHLFAAGQPLDAQRPHKVTCAIVAGTGTLGALKDIRRDDLESRLHPIVKGDPIPLVNTDTGEISSLPQPDQDDQRVVPLGKKLFYPSGNREGDPDKPSTKVFFGKASRYKPTDTGPLNEEAAKAQINPLLMPDIKRAADEVRESISGQQKQIIV